MDGNPRSAGSRVRYVNDIAGMPFRLQGRVLPTSTAGDVGIETPSGRIRYSLGPRGGANRPNVSVLTMLVLKLLLVKLTIAIAFGIVILALL